MGDLGDEQFRDLMARAPRHKFTVSDYHRMADAGIFAPDDRVELIDGEIFEMGKIGSQHAGVVNFLIRRLVLAAGDRFILTPQNPIEVSRYSEPQPDLAFVAPRADFYREAPELQVGIDEIFGPG